MKCPHCLESFHDAPTQTALGVDQEWAHYVFEHQNCPACRRWVCRLIMLRAGTTSSYFVYPKSASRKPLSPDVPEKFAQDYNEAVAVLADSAKASAALSRRCLQSLLRERAGVKHQDLSKEIDDVLKSRQLPTHLAESVDAIRAIGNFAAHPIKSTSSGEIVEVEAGEAEWQIEVLEGLFDFYFVQPAVTKAKRDALNKKLADAGKPPIK